MRRTILAGALGTAALLGSGAVAVNLVTAGGASAQVSVIADNAAGSATAATKADGPVETVLAKLVADGTLTQAQADKVLTALKDALPARGQRGPGGDGPRAMTGGRHGGRRIGLDAVAGALGVSADELRTSLQNGTSIADLAKTKGVDLTKVIDAVKAEAKTHLDEAVKAGKLTQADADARLTQLTARITDFVNGKMPAFGGDHDGDGPHGPPMGMGNAPATQNASAPASA